MSMRHSESRDVSLEELALAARNHSMPLEALRYSVTPPGLHYVLSHFDIPYVDPLAWRLHVGGSVHRSLELTLNDLFARPTIAQRVTLECAGNGRALLSPRPITQPWLLEAVGTAEWSGIELRSLLEEAGVRAGAVEVLFSALDRGVQRDIEHDSERSLPLDVAMNGTVLLAFRMNGEALPPQHGFPLRVIVPGWYGMAHVKWVHRITVIDQPFSGIQQDFYRVQLAEEELGIPVTRMSVRALMIPPGIPDYFTRARFLDPGRHAIEGRAWSGKASVASVEVSTDGGRVWMPAHLGESDGPFAWRAWTFTWDAQPGTYELCCRATDADGNTQPAKHSWNYRGIANNAIQRVEATVR